jgi:hypothetical protein
MIRCTRIAVADATAVPRSCSCQLLAVSSSVALPLVIPFKDEHPVMPLIAR